MNILSHWPATELEREYLNIKQFNIFKLIEDAPLDTFRFSNISDILRRRRPNITIISLFCFRVHFKDHRYISHRIAQGKENIEITQEK
jgi:hypothetical protein